MNELLTDTQTLVETELHRIYERIAAEPVGGNFSLLSGQTGYAVFESYYLRHFGLTDNSRVWERLGAGINAIQSGDVDHTFAGGISGIAWAFLHLHNHGFLADSSDDPHDIVAALDEPLFLLSMDDLYAGSFDYLHGGLGACLYFLERPRSAETVYYLTEIVNQLEKIALKKTDGSITWYFRNFDRPDDRSVSYNLGLSHGTASIVAVLSLLYRHGYAQNQCARLIEGGLQWLWSVRNENNPAVFPRQLFDDQPRDEFSRMAWCYGDLGIAHTFQLAGEIFNHNRWKQIAELTMLKAATRRSRKETLVSDTAFCHGSGGISHLFARFAQSHPNPVLDETARFWLQVTLDHALPSSENDILQQPIPLSIRGDLSFLDGEASIGMILLSQLGADTAWERAFLLR
ncbi:lanthionine synthetase C family protein [Larkinella terrae]|uniref:Lanthionine synthetase n=1 Tax=Larkinella terrae TaxID=2025311 RepID=A0A7K0EN34_9BACT|nr:lanthionine synthetase C family protein [Larkinella terrae]MRS63199.1 lanthionine synthetase [Larkinella terrae]